MNTEMFDAREAKLEYGHANFQMIEPGSFVRCAVTGARIPVNELKYWNPWLQEAYVDAQAATTRWKQVEAEKDQS